MVGEPNYHIPDCECPVCDPDVLKPLEYWVIQGAVLALVLCLMGFGAVIGWTARGLLG